MIVMDKYCVSKWNHSDRLSSRRRVRLMKYRKLNDLNRRGRERNSRIAPNEDKSTG